MARAAATAATAPAAVQAEGAKTKCSGGAPGGKPGFSEEGTPILGPVSPQIHNTADNFTVGNIARFVNEWFKVIKDPWVLAMVTGAHLNFTQDPQQMRPAVPFRLSGEERLTVGEEIDKLLIKGVIERTCPTPGQVVSNVFLRPKPNGQHRLILDLMDLYKYEHFKISFDMMRKDCWMALVDLKDAYYSVPVAQEERKFLRFLWEGQMFQFVALPNGLASVSRIFTKILTPLDAKLRESGLECCPYIDDSFVVADTVEKCQETVKILCEQLDKLGFVRGDVKILLLHLVTFCKG